MAMVARTSRIPEVIGTAHAGRSPGLLRCGTIRSTPAFPLRFERESVEQWPGASSPIVRWQLTVAGTAPESRRKRLAQAYRVKTITSALTGFPINPPDQIGSWNQQAYAKNSNVT